MHGDDEGGPATRRSDHLHVAHAIRFGDAFAGKYRIESVLGSGGMGTVLRAHHIQLDRPVAIKVMHSELLAVGDAARRFALEARATAALKSSHAVRIIDIDRLPSGEPFIVMELLDGMDLAKIVEQRGPLTVDRAVHYLLQAADAIAEAHGQGIVHRDLKPQNMFLTAEGIVKVVDFGLAKALRPFGSAPESGQTMANILVGSPAYMSPEQIWSAHSVDQRADIWGLGATLYHLLTGAGPFAAYDMDTLASLIANSDPPAVAARRHDVSPTVDAVIARCLRKNREDRYQTIASFQGALLHLRVELQQGASRSRAHPLDNVNTVMTPLGGTMPLATRRVPMPSAEQDPDNAFTIAPSTQPDSPPQMARDGGPITDDDEPTQIIVGADSTLKT